MILYLAISVMRKHFKLIYFSLFFAALFHLIQKTIILYKSLQINLQHLKDGLNLHTVLKIRSFLMLEGLYYMSPML